jgi:hypothetical protein
MPFCAQKNIRTTFGEEITTTLKKIEEMKTFHSFNTRKKERKNFPYQFSDRFG